MINLNKNDIEQVAGHRYNSKYIRRIIAYVAILIGIVVLIAIFVPDSAPLPFKIVSFGSLIVYYLAGAFYYVRSKGRYIKAFIEKVESDPELRYEKS